MHVRSLISEVSSTITTYSSHNPNTIHNQEDNEGNLQPFLEAYSSCYSINIRISGRATDVHHDAHTKMMGLKEEEEEEEEKMMKKKKNFMRIYSNNPS